jgi:tetratricopeptide (TPR) repeat protein
VVLPREGRKDPPYTKRRLQAGPVAQCCQVRGAVSICQMRTRTFAKSHPALLLIQISVVLVLYACVRMQQLQAVPTLQAEISKAQSGNTAPPCHGQSACFQLALSLARLHRYQAAAAALKRVRSPARPDEQIAYDRLRAAIAAGIGDSRAAARDMEQALRLAPDDPFLIISTGIMEVEAQNPDRATQLLKPLFSRDPEALPGVWLLRAQLALKQNPEQTLHTLQTIQVPADQRLSWYLDLGTTLADGGLHAQAAREFQKAAALEPGRAAVRYDVALEQYQAGQVAAALATINKLKRLHDSAALEALKADVEEARADYVDAVHCDQYAVALAPKEEKYRLLLGYELLTHESYQPALVVFRQTVGLFPASVRARVALGMTYFFLQRYQQASGALINAVEMDRKSYFALNYLGITQQDQPVPVRPAAITAICRRAASDPGSGVAATYCGALSFRRAYEAGDKSGSEEIVQQLHKAVTLSPENPVGNCELGKALEWVGQWSAARMQMEQCVKLQPDSPDNHYHLAQIYQRLGLSGLARQQFDLQEAGRRKMGKEIAYRNATVKGFLYSLRAGTGLASGQAPINPSPEIKKESIHSASTRP